MWNEGDKINCCRVSLKHDSTIPACHEKLVIGQCPMNILEETEKFTDRYGLLVARSLVDMQEGKVVIQLMIPGCGMKLKHGIKMDCLPPT